MEQKDQHHNSGNGFLFGVIVGVLVTLLFTTKRGREILKEVTDKGIKKWSELEKLSKEMQEEDFGEDEMDDAPEDYISPEEKKEVPAKQDVMDEVKEEKAPAKQDVKAEVKEEKVPAKQDVKGEPKEEKVPPVVGEEKKSSEKTLTGRRWFRGLRKKG